MAFIPVPNVVQSTLFFQGQGGLFAQNRLYLAASDPPTSTDLDEIDDALYDVVVAQYCEVMSHFWAFAGMTHRAMNEEEGLQLISSQSYPIDGRIGDTEQEAAQVCYTVTLNTGVIGRSARGRVYGVGMPNNYADGARLEVGGQSNLQSAWELVLSAMATAGHAIQVVSFQEGGVFRTEGRPLSVLSVAVRFPIATQRRRLR